MSALWKRGRIAAMTLSLSLAASGCSVFAAPGSTPDAVGNSPAAAGEAPSPALLVSPSDPATRQALLAALRDLLGDRSFTLADDAFAKASELVLERARPPGEAGRYATGREMTPPIRVRLLAASGRCILERADTGARVNVGAARCRAVAVP